MKIKLLEKNYLKALDIDLKLNNPSSKNTSSLVNDISKIIEGFYSELDLRIEGAGGEIRKLFIPDDAKIERFDIKEWKNKKEISNRIRTDASETFYFLISKDDNLLSSVVDGVAMQTARAPLSELLEDVDYVLIVKREEFLKTKSKKEERVSSEQSSLELQKVKRKEELFIKFRKAYINLEKEKDIYYIILSNIPKNENVSKKNQSYSPPKNLKPILVRNLKKGMYVFISSNPNEDDKIFKILKDIDPPFPNNAVNIKAQVLEQKTFNITEKEQDFPNISVDGTLYLYDPNEQREEEKEEDFDFEIEQFIPEVDLKALIKKDTTFPSNLFPTYNNRDLQLQVNRIKDDWIDLKNLIDKLKSKNINVNQALEQVLENFESSLEAGFRKSSNMSYTDKSGYRVDLGKYFDKLVSLPPSVPKNIKDFYEKTFSYLTTQSKQIVNYINLAVEQEDFDLVGSLSSLMTHNGPRAFNNKFKNYLDENTWDRNSRSYKRPKKALQEMIEFKEELSNDYSRLESRITNLVSK
jgi:hypothetical protein